MHERSAPRFALLEIDVASRLSVSYSCDLGVMCTIDIDAFEPNEKFIKAPTSWGQRLSDSVVGEVLYCVAELNNSLTVVRGYVDLSSNRSGLDAAQLRRNIDYIDEAACRMIDLVRRLGSCVQFAPPSRVPQPQWVDPRVSLTGTVLLVDDDSQVRTILRNTMTHWGCTVIEAASGDEAMTRSQEYEGVIHVLLTDVAMEGIDGHALAVHLAKLRPSMKVIYMSGRPSELPKNESVVFLNKPIEIFRELASALEGLLQS